ncbi:MAG: permease, partial [Sphaerochaeta sp.]|nr:permease [Sphaerochaeta sp.]
MATIIIIYALLAVGLVFSLAKSKEKTKKAFKVAGKSLLKTAPALLAMLGIVGLILGVLTPEKISSLIGSEAGFLATITAAVIGSLT